MSNNLSKIETDNILKVTESDFETTALAVFRYQHKNNELYNTYCKALHIDPTIIKKLNQIPFLPISFFKTNEVIIGNPKDAELIFESSGTTGDVASKHYVKDAQIYEQSLLQGFEQFYGSPTEYAILALLPSYLERGNASLVHMAKLLMQHSGNPNNGFYINEWKQLHDVITKLEQKQQKTLLLGVTFALLDFAEAYPIQLNNTLVMETGGMKGRKEELTRTSVHNILKKQFGVKQVNSEYGMTELLSQAYAKTDGVFGSTNTMKVMVRDIYDPLDVQEHGTGCLNIIDLANIYSCSFIATEDIGKVNENGDFEVLGRIDNSALRGCNLMVL